jgi:hypothetical protein
VGFLFDLTFPAVSHEPDEQLPQARVPTALHEHSNVESTFSMMKRKFGDSIRSKTDAHNLVVLIHEMYELGIDPVFWSNGIVSSVTSLHARKGTLLMLCPWCGTSDAQTAPSVLFSQIKAFKKDFRFRNIAPVISED